MFSGVDYDNVPIVAHKELGEAKYPCKFCPTTAKYSVQFYHEGETSGGSPYFIGRGTFEDANLCTDCFRRQKVLQFFQDPPKGLDARRAYEDSIGVVWAEAQRQLGMSDEPLTLTDLLSSDELKVEISPARSKEKSS